MSGSHEIGLSCRSGTVAYVTRVPNLASSDGRAAFCSDQAKCGHAARLVGPSRLTPTGHSPRYRVASVRATTYSSIGGCGCH